MARMKKAYRVFNQFCMSKELNVNAMNSKIIFLTKKVQIRERLISLSVWKEYNTFLRRYDVAKRNELCLESVSWGHFCCSYVHQELPRGKARW